MRFQPRMTGPLVAMVLCLFTDCAQALPSATGRLMVGGDDASVPAPFGDEQRLRGRQ